MGAPALFVCLAQSNARQNVSIRQQKLRTQEKLRVGTPIYLPSLLSCLL
jgi:hypothetical protein